MNLTKNRASKCVMARIMRRGEKHQKNFTLREFKTWKAAETAATKWVRKMKKQLPDEAERRGRMTKRNSSGVVGVWPIIDRHRLESGTYEYCRWGARWPGCPVRGGIRFSVSEFGDKDAFVLACLAVENESTDRDWLIKKMKRLKGGKKYKTLLQKKLIDFEY